MYNVLFPIRWIYLRQIMDGRKNHELRGYSPRWGKIAITVMKKLDAHEEVIGVFLCGRTVYRRKIIGVVPYLSAEAVLGQPLSEQGRKDVGTGPGWDFSLGEEVKQTKHQQEMKL